MIRAALAAFLIALASALPALAQAPAKRDSVPGRESQAAPPPPPLAVAPVIAPGTPIKPGQAFRDCPECPNMVALPPGIFIMGSDTGPKGERPSRPVRVLKAFAIGKYEVTFDEWEACAKAGGCAAVPDDHKWGRGRRPIINIDWPTARKYAEWLAKKTGKPYRLPSEAEWEYAARAGTATKFPWGDEAGLDNANCRKCGAVLGGVSSAPVGSFKPNPWGLHDFNGNVWEWVEDCWNPNHEGAPKDQRARLDGDCNLRVRRGGSWYYFGEVARSSSRTFDPVAVFSYGTGVRVARDLP